MLGRLLPFRSPRRAPVTRLRLARPRERTAIVVEGLSALQSLTISDDERTVSLLADEVATAPIPWPPTSEAV